MVAASFVFIDPANFDFQRFGSAPVNVAMFAALFVAFGALTAWLFDRFRRAIEGTRRAAGALEVLAWLAAFAVIALSALTVFSVGGLDQPLSGLLFAAVTIVPAIGRWRALPPVIAYAAFALPFVLGALRTLSGIGQMLD